MGTTFHDWLDNLRAKRERWVLANHENNFDRGIWNATVDKYADPSHFIFELLQNAEDTGATWVRFALEPTRIVFEHNGRPFDRDDIEGITGIGNTTKLDDGHKIGCFGIGFKSVYVVTERPEIHSFVEDESLAFAIENLVVPRLIESGHAEATTRIVLPLRADRADLTLTRAREGLTASGARSLLFLRNIKRLEWTDGALRGSAQVTDADGSIRSIHSHMPDGTNHVDRFLVLARAVEHQKDRKQYEVKAAFRINGAGDLIPEEAPTRLMVFFETEELTGLHFIIHGPFQLTDNRGNIKREDSWNAGLVDAIAGMIADALPSLRDRGMLKRTALGILPNASDELPTTFAPILDAIIAKFADEALIPVHGGGFATTATGIRGPADLRDLLGELGLAEFCQRPDRHWVIAAPKNSRIDTFINTLNLEEFGLSGFFSSFRHVLGAQPLVRDGDKDWRQRGLKWFNALPDEQLQHFYLALEAALKVQRPSVNISDLQFVRLEDGRRHSPKHAVFAPIDSDLGQETEQDELYLVKKNLIRLGRGRGKDVEEFLRRMGVRDLDERAFLTAIIRTKYRGNGPRPNREQHLRHMRRFVRWWKDTGEVNLFNNVAFIRAGEDGAYKVAGNVYLGSPYLESGLQRIYDGEIAGRDRMALWEGYKSLPRKDLLTFLEKCGVEDRLVVWSSPIPFGHPNYGELRHGWGGARFTGTGANSDYRIDQLPEILARQDPTISKLVWDAANRFGAATMVASFSPNQTYPARKRPSSMAIALRDAAWIPTKDGRLRKPNEITQSDLAKGYTVGGNEDWLRAIGFGEQDRQRSELAKARRQAAELIGLPSELVDQLGSLSSDALAAFSAEMIRTINSRSFEPIEFPERESGNPARRAERLAARAQAAPTKSSEVRERSVRTNNTESRTLARAYLEDHYTNPVGEMVCQGCHGKMPFNLADGSPYFEAVECLDSLEREQAENHLALCPVCAAKWRHANPIDDIDLRARISAATVPEITVELAGESSRVRFTQMHLDDLRTVARIGLPGFASTADTSRASSGS
ncbi:sacsin N-terminal ATP-binding-like domain-containing protein [Rhizobium bangladeshense]|uniref:sacsin N-terminal ATP-binding-like domain-containing protein n=1 Tax=Rhizobium bangladeshense TaxID=1138189 RepID=UPI001A9851F4|nr:hypothetical protein [Rhizobium bangladeshense]MBX4935191.1 hypothetical protein [Rhizobium bangladeshense]QSY91694.1 hypothetical protein J2J98_24655 [Rhizobium bangladeshense]